MAGGKDLGALTGQLGADTRQWERAVNKVNRDLMRMERVGTSAATKISAGFTRMGNKLSSVGRTMTRRVSLPLAALGAGSLKMASDFESSFSKIEGLVGVAADEVARMKAEVLDMGGEVAQTPKDLADALFFVTSAGFRGQEALDVLHASARAATAGLGETKTVADLVTSAVNAYGIENLSAANATDVLTAAVREGKAEAPELAASLGQVLPVASQMGISFDQVGAAVAAMTRTGTNAGTASMQLRQILASLLKPTTQAEEALSEMGTSSANLRKTLREDGLVAVLGFLKDQMDENEQAMAQVFPNIRALSGALDIMGSNAKENVAIFERMTDTTGTLDKASKAAASTMRVQFNQALADLQAEAIRFGDMLMPLAKQIVQWARDGLKALRNMSDETRRFGLAIAGLTLVAGPAISILGKLLLAIGALTSPAFLAGAAITALFTSVVVGGQWMVDNWDKIELKISAITQSIILAFQKMTLGIMQNLRTFMDFVLTKIPPVMMAEFFGIDVTGWAQDVTGVTQIINDLNQSIGEGRYELQDTIGKYNELEWGSLTDSAVNALRLAKNRIIDGLRAIVDSDAIQGLLDEFDAIFSGLGGEGEGEEGESGGGLLGLDNIDIGGFADNYVKDISKMKASTEGFASVTEAAMQKAEMSWEDFKNKFFEIGGDFQQFLAKEISGAVLDFTEALGRSLSGATDNFATTFEKITLIVLDFAKSLARLAAGIGAVMLFIPGMQGAGAGLLAAAGALNAITAGFTAGIKKRMKNREQRAQAQVTSVNDAIIKSDGSVINLHPNDDILAMKELGGLGTQAPATRGSNEIQLSGQFRIQGTDLVLTLERTRQMHDR